MKFPLIALIASVLSLTTFSVCRTDDQDKKSEQEKSSIWMKKKLELSQGILAGLTEENFDKIGANAKAMNYLGYLEKFARGDTPEYKRQVIHFDSANQELIRQAGKKNLQGATLAYNLLTISCVNCHMIVRDKKK